VNEEGTGRDRSSIKKDVRGYEKTSG